MGRFPGDDDEAGEDLPDEQEVPRRGDRGRPARRGSGGGGDDDDDEFDDLPSTHLSEADYERFLASELDREGRVKGDPPVTSILLGLIALVVIAAAVWALFLR